MRNLYLKGACMLLALSISANSFAEDKKIPNYSTTPRKDVPEEFKWKIEDIYASDEAWQKDKDNLKKLISQIDETSKDWTSSAQKMLSMFRLSDDIGKLSARLAQYAVRQSDMEISNPKFTVMKGEIQAIGVEYGMKMSFMNDDLRNLDEKTFQGYLKEVPELKDYKFTVEQVFREKPHILTSEQQKIMSLTGLFSPAISQTAGILNDVDIPAPEVTLSNGEKVTLNYANYSLYRASKNADDREKVMKTFWENHKKYENTFAALFDGGMKQDLFRARATNYKTCLEARLFGEDIDTSVYMTLISKVNSNLSPLHRYLKLKQSLLGLEKMRYEDIYASAVKKVDKKYTFDEARQIIMESVKPLGEEYTKAVGRGFTERWIDIYPNKDKQTGAYSTGVYGVHPYIKMNYSGTYSDMSTLIHELGHSIHTYLSERNQPYADYGYTTFLAEIASTFNENLLMDNILKNEKDDMLKLFILDSFLERARATIYRQTLFAEFELAMHQRVEAGKSLTAEWLNKTFLDLTRKYYGHDKGVMEVGDYIQCEWSTVPHFFRSFYVFQYSTGIIASMALSENLLTGKPQALDKYLSLLKAGGSDYPLNILKKAGVDMRTAEPYEAAFRKFDSLVGEMEKIVDRLKKDGRM